MKIFQSVLFFNPSRKIYSLVIAILFILLAEISWAKGKEGVSVGDIYGRSGCCSSHGGVCGYECFEGISNDLGSRCCDGTPLSETCAPYYSSCPATPTYTDADKDGYYAETNDCNDSNASVHPNAVEVCNGIDDNCNDQIDEGVKNTFYQDTDLDGYGNSGVTIEACSSGNGYVSDFSDCNDNSSSVYPGASEICGDEIDQNCDGADLACPQISIVKDSYLIGKDATFIATISYSGTLNNVFLYYRSAGSLNTYTQKDMVLDINSQWTVTILSQDISNNGLEYYISANDSVGNSSETEPKEAYVLVPTLTQFGVLILFLLILFKSMRELCVNTRC